MAQSTDVPVMDEQPTILRPIPRRSFEVSNVSSENSSPAMPTSESNGQRQDSRVSKDMPPSRTQSVLNLTSSTLFGIYSPASDGDRDEPPTPASAGMQTPILGRVIAENMPLPFPHDGARTQRPAVMHHGHYASQHLLLSLATRTVLLFIFGVSYGVIITHLQDEQRLAAVKVEKFNRYDGPYLLFWGAAGVGLGSLLPWVDLLWEDKVEQQRLVAATKPTTMLKKSGPKIDEKDDDILNTPTWMGNVLGGDWNPVVRSIGAFVGIAFAIRKLPWQSTLQVSLTLALVNPVLWYLIDRSKPGFFLSTLVGLTGTALLFNINPDILPSPATVSPPASSTPILTTTSSSLWSSLGNSSSIGGFLCAETIGVGTWIASVLFCSCVCFGNIGRRLALRARPSS